jgi:[protein-PII] uridylyltransferase
MATTSTESVNIPRNSIREKTPEISSEEVDAHFNLMPDRYYAYHNEDEIVLHLRMVHRLLKTIAEADSLGALVPVVEWHDDLNLDLTVVNVVTWDRAGLFYKLAGAFSLAGLNIISSKALTRADHITIDTFYVTDLNGDFVSSKKAFEVFQTHLKDALLHNKDLMPELKKQSLAKAQPSYLQKQEHLPASIPAKVDIYHELSLRRTIIEVQCNDEIGLLYRLTKAIYDHGFDITFGRISTERHVVADTFYIEPIQPNTNGDTSPIVELRSALEEIVQSVGQG